MEKLTKGIISEDTSGLSDVQVAARQALAEVDRLRALERTNRELRETVAEQRRFIYLAELVRDGWIRSAREWEAVAKIGWSALAAVLFGGALAAAFFWGRS